MSEYKAIRAWCMALAGGMLFIGMPVWSIVVGDPAPWLIGWGLPVFLVIPPVLFVWWRERKGGDK